MDEEELQKRFTDCVYFLASPLTCKKGIECEYRHSEIARLNPRDCWYWLGGCCFNPDCAFRHPPLEGFKEAYHESSNLNGNALPMEKTNIPCYFYSKGFCNKGERCSFLHGPADSWKPPMVNNSVPCEKKLSAGGNTGSTPVDTQPDQSETAQIENTNTEKKLTQDSQQETSESESLDVSATESQENVVRSKSNSLIEYVQSESDVFNDQSPDEQTGWLESPPGFDVLVEGESERLDADSDSDSDADADYFSVHDEDAYDPAYPELGNQYKEKYNVYDRVDDTRAHNYLDTVSDQSRKSIFYRLSFKKRVPIFRRGTDLRDHLKKRKVVDNGFSQGYYGPPQVKRRVSRGELRKGMGVHVSNHRVPLKEKKPRKSHFMQQKKSFKEEGGIFTGPKTLDQIKEEKKNALQNRDGFQGPRPLSEILKNKRKL